MHLTLMFWKRDYILTVYFGGRSIEQDVVRRGI